MSEATVFPVKPGILKRGEKKALKDAGIIVIEHPNPEECRLIKGQMEVDPGDMLRCAIHAIEQDSFDYSKKQFLRNLNALFNPNEDFNDP